MRRHKGKALPLPSFPDVSKIHALCACRVSIKFAARQQDAWEERYMDTAISHTMYRRRKLFPLDRMQVSAEKLCAAQPRLFAGSNLLMPNGSDARERFARCSPHSKKSEGNEGSRSGPHVQCARQTQPSQRVCSLRSPKHGPCRPADLLARTIQIPCRECVE